MPVFISHIETLLPRNSCSQEEAAEWLASRYRDKKYQRLIRCACRSSGIATRHSVLADFHPDAAAPLFGTGPDGNPLEPTTGSRNDRFVQAARAMAVDVAGNALAACAAITPRDVTHVIYVTCTGFANPGPDYHIVRNLGLRPEVQRYVLGFMGCSAAVPALRLADQFCRADPSAVVLLVANELCTLHLQFDPTKDSILANAIFSDGAAAAIVSTRTAPPGKNVLAVDGFASALIPGGEEDMAWRIGDRGFRITLSAYVPDLISADIHSLIEPVLKEHALRAEDIDLWAIHPGGKAILDGVQSALRLQPQQVASSRNVLRDCGNMSSATILFVLKDLLAKNLGDGVGDRRTLAMAFGPGLSVECALLRLINGNNRAA